MAIEERIKKAVTKAMGNKKVFDRLEEKSGIKNSSWQAMLYGRQRATSEMIEFVCREWPDYAFWICTGYLADSSVNHTSPKKEQVLDLKIDITELLKKEPIDWSIDEFKYAYVRVMEEHDEAVSHELLHEMLKRSGGTYSEYQYFCSPLKIAFDARKQEKLLKKFIEDVNNTFEEKIANPPMVKGMSHVLVGWRKSQENFKNACNELMKIKNS